MHLVAQLCPTLCDPMDCSPPGSSAHGDSPGKNIGVGCHALFQGIFPTQESNPGLPHCKQILYHLSHQRSTRTLEWVAYPFSTGSSWPRNWTRVSGIAGGFFTSRATREAYWYWVECCVNVSQVMLVGSVIQVYYMLANFLCTCQLLRVGVEIWL